MRDFFVSYTGADVAWAQWIGWVLEEKGYTVVLQEWDFRPGSNFVIQMQRATTEAKHTIAVLSRSYLEARFTEPEWAAAFVQDPTGSQRALIPVRVEDCTPPGLLNSVVYIDLVDCNEAVASQRLLAGIQPGRAKPKKAPTFPGKTSSKRVVPEHPAFPSLVEPQSTAKTAKPYNPRIKKEASDLVKGRFVRNAFNSIRNYFQNSLKYLAEQDSEVEVDFEEIDAVKFVCSVYVGEKLANKCKIWLTSSGSTMEIRYSSSNRMGIESDNSFNDALLLGNSPYELNLMATMGHAFYGDTNGGLNLKELSADDSAEYLWRRFMKEISI